ncbi:MAG: serine hydrolase [Alphaproteobacteria bacterium]|nr:serine hydrolase [Alphaproteobacteria bacterium]
MNRYSTIAFLAALLPCVASAQTVPTDPEIRKLLATRVDTQHWATGIVVDLITPQGTHTIAYGTTAKGGTQNVDADTVYDIGSITKVFTALVLADMARHGEVALDDPVTKYLPKDIVLPIDGARQITLADLATHTAGLPLRPDNLAPKDPDNKYAEYSEADLFQYLAHAKPANPIGATYEYSNSGFGLLGVALAHRAGTDLDTLIKRRILEPLGMDDTIRTATPTLRSRMAQGYSYDFGSADLTPAEHWDYGNGIAGAGGYRSTAADIAKFLQAILGYRKSPLAPAFAAMTKTRRPGGMTPATAIALAWNILDQDGREIVWKNGSVGGFRAFIGYDAAARIGLIALANAQTATGMDDIGLHILDPKLPVDLNIPHPHTEVAIEPKVLDNYVGTYEYSDTDSMTISREGNRLFAQEPGQDRYELFAEGPRDFFLKLIDAQVTFETGQNGKAIAAVWHQGGQDQRGIRINP